MWSSQVRDQIGAADAAYTTAAATVDAKPTLQGREANLRLARQRRRRARGSTARAPTAVF